MAHRVFSGILIIVVITLSSGRDLPDIVAGNLQQFNENGVWSLYQDQQVVVDSLKKTR